MEIVRKSISKWIVAVVVLVIGILCIVAGSSNDAKSGAYEGISVTIGVTLIVISSLSLILALVTTILSKGKVMFIALGAASATTLATGIFFVTYRGLGGELIEILINYIPFVLLCIGSIIAVDAILVLAFGLPDKEKAKSSAIAATVEFIIAAIAIVLGALMVGQDSVISKSAQMITFGIILVIYSLIFCASTLLVKSYKESNSIHPDAMDAEVKEVENNDNN